MVERFNECMADAPKKTHRFVSREDMQQISQGYVGHTAVNCTSPTGQQNAYADHESGTTSGHMIHTGCDRLGHRFDNVTTIKPQEFP